MGEAFQLQASSVRQEGVAEATITRIRDRRAWGARQTAHGEERRLETWAIGHCQALDMPSVLPRPGGCFLGIRSAGLPFAYFYTVGNI